jgi:hypothetical protein
MADDIAGLSRFLFPKRVAQIFKSAVLVMGTAVDLKVRATCSVMPVFLSEAKDITPGEMLRFAQHDTASFAVSPISARHR